MPKREILIDQDGDSQFYSIETVTSSIETDDFILTFEDSDEVRQKLYFAMLSFFIKYEIFTDNSILENDGIRTKISGLLANIVDEIFQFTVKWKG